ncbi:MAG: glycosyltransferase family 2 protein [Pirellulales bacterium]|nr:glycosyltransferase family 2 protein [Pirellulales bacterium]
MTKPFKGEIAEENRADRWGATGLEAVHAKLTVLIPCSNERKNIRDCIRSIRAVADEILVADSGSTDGTLEIAAEMGCRIIRREYINSADFKNWAIPQAAHPWVFIIDADERVPEALLGEVRAVLENPREDLDAYSCGFQDFFMGYALHYARWDTESIRLIRRDVCRYQRRRVHANIDIDLNRVGRLKTQILHYSVWDYEDLIRKYNRYTSWGSRELWDRGRRATFWSLLVRPTLRFLHTYIIRRGFLDGLPGLQACIMMAFFSTFMKQAKLWQMQSGIAQPDPEAECETNAVVAFLTREDFLPRGSSDASNTGGDSVERAA